MSDASRAARIEPLRWGVLGATSAIARRAVLPAIAASPQSRLVAIATRTAADGASATVTDLLTPRDLRDVRIYSRYDEVIEDPNVEAVYVPLPNGLHAEWTKRAAGAGKHVLCEKPLSPDPAEARAMVGACDEAGVVLAEAYMTPFHPRSRRLVEVAASGALGALRFARGAFTFPLERPHDHRWDPVMGAGALADLGVYCLAPLLGAAGHPPVSYAAAARLTSRGVDASLSGWLDFGDGFVGLVECSFETPERQVLEFVGTKGAVRVEHAFTSDERDTGFDVQERDGGFTHVETGSADPYRVMVDDFAAVVRGTARQERSGADAVELIEVADDLRRAAGTRLAVRGEDGPEPA